MSVISEAYWTVKFPPVDKIHGFRGGLDSCGISLDVRGQFWDKSVQYPS